MRTREPGGTPLADRIREILLDAASAPLSAQAELFLYMASRAEHCNKVIAPALKVGKLVLCDRFCDATLTYQGHGRGLAREWIATLNEKATGGLSPDLTLLLDCPVALGLARARARIAAAKGPKREDRFEEEDTSFHERVRSGYLDIARREPERIAVIDASGTPEFVFTQVQDIINGKFDASLTHHRSR